MVPVGTIVMHHRLEQRFRYKVQFFIISDRARESDTQEDYFHCGGKTQEVLDVRLENIWCGLYQLNGNDGLTKTIKTRQPLKISKYTI